ncbi:MAG: hypothetical protein AAF587_04345 [Bacteroidota bacterium]
MKLFAIFWGAILMASTASLAQSLPKDSPLYLKRGQHYLSLSNPSVNMSRRMATPGIPVSNPAFSFHNISQISLGLGYGYMIADRWLLGSRFRYQGQFVQEVQVSGTNGTFAKGSSHRGEVNLYTRYHFSRGKLSPFVEAGIGADVYISNVGPQIGYGYQEVKVGLLYHANQRLSLELSNGFKHRAFDYPVFPGGSEPVRQRLFDFFTPHFGLNIRL